jgi:hypothetical protein
MKFYEMLERLAEMFPRQDFQSRLERYIESRRPSNIKDVENCVKQFESQEFRGLSL